MKILTTRARWFLSFAVAALLVTGTFTGCDNKDNTASPTATVQIQNPNLSHAIDIQNRHTDDLMSIDGVIGTGTGLHDDGSPAIYIFTSRDNVAGLPSSLEGIGTRIQNIGIVTAGIPGILEGTHKGSAVPQAAAFTGQDRNPMHSGFSIGNDKECAAGTISCVVSDGTNKYLLSNNHVFARVNAASIGERIDQQGRYDAIPQCAQTGKVATLSRFFPINFNRHATNVVDCAIAQISGGITATSQTPPENAPALQYTPSATTMGATVGMSVMKTGRTTGFTTGMIAAINVNVSVSYGGGKTAKFVNQLYINSTTFSAAGDSGSLIVESVNTGNPMPVGLLFAGSSNSTIANPIATVLIDLGVTIVAQ
jgi:hypothetical protein